MPSLSNERWEQILQIRATEPRRIVDALQNRNQRDLIGGDGRLFIIAADHSARGMMGVPDDPFAMADRRRTIDALCVALDHPGVDGVLASSDIIEDLALLGKLEKKLVFGTMNRGGLMGAKWELDDRMTAYSAATIRQYGLDGGKVLLRIADDDPGTASTIEACARAVDECAAIGVPIMVEPLPYHLDADGNAALLHDDDALLRAIAIGSGLGSTSTYTWLKVPATANPERLLACTSLPALILGGTPSADPEATYALWEKAMTVPNARGLVVGRSVLYPANGDVAGAVDRAARIAHNRPRT